MNNFLLPKKKVFKFQNVSALESTFIIRILFIFYEE